METFTPGQDVFITCGFESQNSKRINIQIVPAIITSVWFDPSDSVWYALCGIDPSGFDLKPGEQKGFTFAFDMIFASIEEAYESVNLKYKTNPNFI